MAGKCGQLPRSLGHPVFVQNLTGQQIGVLILGKRKRTQHYAEMVLRIGSTHFGIVEI